MSATISSINYCPVKSVSFQTIENCKIKKDIGIIGDRIFAFAKDLDLEQAKLFEKSPAEKLFDDPQNERTKQFLHAVLDAN